MNRARVVTSYIFGAGRREMDSEIMTSRAEMGFPKKVKAPSKGVPVGLMVSLVALTE